MLTIFFRMFGNLFQFWFLSRFLFLNFKVIFIGGRLLGWIHILAIIIKRFSFLVWLKEKIDILIMKFWWILALFLRGSWLDHIIFFSFIYSQTLSLSLSAFQCIFFNKNLFDDQFFNLNENLFLDVDRNLDYLFDSSFTCVKVNLFLIFIFIFLKDLDLTIRNHFRGDIALNNTSA